MSRSRPFLLWLALSLAAPLGAAAAEVPFPSRSPYASVSQWVGLTNITVRYTTPAVAGRPLWGSVIKPGAVWLVGDGAAPTIAFSRDVVVGDAAIPAGTYALLAIPSKSDWTIILNRETKLWRADSRNPALDVARVTAHAEATAPRERLAFVFSDFTDDRATMDLEWATIRVRIPIGLRTAEQVAGAMQTLDSAWQANAEAARYLLEKKDYGAGLKYANQSLALRETWYGFWIKASLLAARGDYPGARAAAERSFELGHAAGSEFTTLESTVQAALATWSAPGAPAPASPAPKQRGGRPRRLHRASEARVAKAPPLSGGAFLVNGDQDLEPMPAPSERHVEARRAETPRPTGAAFSRVIKHGRPDLQRCYQRALRQDPTLGTAKVTVSIDVGTTGRVTNVSVAPPLPTGALESCLKDTVSRWAFPPSPVEYETQVPLALSGR
jgi:TonB family protein